MPERQLIHRAAWTLANQGLVSAGTFATNILLARLLVPAEYGVFALLFGMLMVMQVVTAAIIHYPMSVRAAIQDKHGSRRVAGAATILAALPCLPLGLILCGGLVVFGRSELVLPALTWFVFWQMQEAMRRGLFARFRHDEALFGDTVSYCGQAALILALHAIGPVSLGAALWAMAATSAVAAAIQAAQLRPDLVRPMPLAETARDFWSIGGWALGNALIGVSRWQIMPWLLAALYGPAAAGAFQAAANLVNVTNPIIFGLCNVIPQASARARGDGNVQAWRTARSYALLGLPPLCLAYAALALYPDVFLSLLYGAASPFSGLSLAVQLLVASSLMAYSADMICAFLYGVDASRTALAINALGVAALAFGLPLIAAYGLTGTCMALILANACRSLAAFLTLARMTADERNRTARPA